MTLDALNLNLNHVHSDKSSFFVSFLQIIYNDLCPDLLKNFFDQCYSKVAKNRPTMSDVVKTLSVSTLDFNVL